MLDWAIEENVGSVKGKTLAFVGDTASNMGRSFTRAAPIFGYQLKLASPKGYHPADDVVTPAKGFVHLLSDAKEAVKGADVVAGSTSRKAGSFSVLWLSLPSDEGCGGV